MRLSKLGSLLLNRPPKQSYNLICHKLFLSHRLSDFNDEHPCIFVLSTGRVGSMTVSKLLNLAQNVFSFHEPLPKLFHLNRMAYDYANDLSKRKILIEAYLTARRDLFQHSLLCGKGYVETGPQSTFLFPLIFEAVSASKFIHIVRHPASVIRSGMTRNWYDGHPRDAERIKPLLGSSEFENWGKWGAFEKNIWLWSETNRWIRFYLDKLPQNRCIRIHAEDIFEAEISTIRLLFDFINSEYPSFKKIKKVLSYKWNKQQHSEHTDKIVWSDRMIEIFNEIAGNTAESFGYFL